MQLDQDTSELWRIFHAVTKELKARDQIAVSWWSCDEIDREFERLSRKFGCSDAEPHRYGFRRFSLSKISEFIARDAAFNNQVKQKMHAWLRKQIDLAAPPIPEQDDWRGFFEGLGDDQEASGTSILTSSNR